MPIIGWGGSRVHTAGSSVIVKCLVVLLDTVPEMTLLLFWISNRSRTTTMSTTEVTGDTINMAWCAGITSLQDAKMFRRKKWKYLILDEAHMIKNWKSQRWQTLLRFNSKRRLLITGACDVWGGG
jgi:SNF2 family DNA or RNA helicase